ncbi:MAG: 4Fe-4S binding protein [Solobacterium sp.]|nr:4Fe-4S binding protein [Solobacterium sp.]
MKESCMKCGACVKLCPYGAMQFPQEDFRIVQEDCIAEFGSDVHAPEYFINRKGE